MSSFTTDVSSFKNIITITTGVSFFKDIITNDRNVNVVVYYWFFSLLK